MASAFAGVDRLLIISTDDIANRTRQQRQAVQAAQQAGVSHLLYTGVPSPYPDGSNPLADSHFWTEIAIAAGNTDWSFLRNNLYTDYLIPPARQAIASGQWFHASGSGRRALVTREDCAAAAAHALLKAEGKRIFDISGPEAVTVAEVAALVSQLSGKPITATSISGPDLQAGLAKAGIPEIMASVLARFDTDVAKGYLGIVSTAVEELTGRPPQSVADYLSANRQALA